AREGMHYGRRGKRDLRYQAGVVAQEGKGTHDRARPPFDRPSDLEVREILLFALLVLPTERRGLPLARRREAAPVHYHLEPPAAPAELAVGSRAQPGFLLHRDGLANAVVLDRAQLGAVMRAEVRLRGLRTEESIAR